MTITLATLNMDAAALADQPRGQAEYGDTTNSARFLQEVLHSAQRRLALSTVARLLLARDKRHAQSGSGPCLGPCPGPDQRVAKAPGHERGQSVPPAAPRFGHAGTDMALSPEALRRIRLECQISDLRRSLHHIEVSTLPQRTKRIVGRSIEDQLTALQERHDALCHAAAV